MASSLIRRFALSIRKLGVGMDVPVLCFCLSLHISCCMLHYYFFSYVVYSSYLYEYSAVYSIHWSMPQRSFPISSLFRINQSHYSISDPQNSLSQKPCTRDISQSDMHQKSKHHKPLSYTYNYQTPNKVNRQGLNSHRQKFTLQQLICTRSFLMINLKRHIQERTSFVTSMFWCRRSRLVVANPKDGL